MGEREVEAEKEGLLINGAQLIKRRGLARGLSYGADIDIESYWVHVTHHEPFSLPISGRRFYLRIV